jgi:hypothetical protein
MNNVPSLDGHLYSLGQAKPVCDSEFVGQSGQMLIGCPERRAGDKGGSEQMRIDPPNASAVQLVGPHEGGDVRMTDRRNPVNHVVCV